LQGFLCSDPERQECIDVSIGINPVYVNVAMAYYPYTRKTNTRQINIVIKYKKRVTCKYCRALLFYNKYYYTYLRVTAAVSIMPLFFVRVIYVFWILCYCVHIIML